jgi:hypothetical protein
MIALDYIHILIATAKLQKKGKREKELVKFNKGTRGQGDRKVFRLVQMDKEGQTKLIYIIYIL